MKTWQKLSLIAAALTLSTAAFADPTGTWRTIDDKTGQAKSLVRISNEGGKYVGRIAEILNGPSVCDICEGEFHGKNLIGQTILWGLKSEGDNKYGGGRIQDPKNGKTYNASMVDNGNSLDVRGYIGVSALGRTQKWQRVK
ncbi:DUF2147 domain-containing protein [Hydromonas duriensis]|uniref:Uncharacterized protein (DUF2147 family) n=1 Tax=Hydromonas duriensis TaxID=1527608 RepID=A0A4R6YAH8_9BURK|nr:DUF2147 domain-containing protein [Hydromonas duriensis]TDR32558.1 uncharacterized protein (DUF2147 family) [Hydromonas duriensis]